MPLISCVVCAYNEGERIEAVLDVIIGHPALAEIIVVDDGSTDDTGSRVAGRQGVKLIRYDVNRGKTYAMCQGVRAAGQNHIMFLDADLAGVTRGDIDALARPVLEGQAQASISLRRNSLGVYRALGVDFVSGERVIPASLLRDHLAAMEALPRWGAEVFINQLLVRRRLSLAIVDWAGIDNVRKAEKLGAIRGFFAELEMIRDACQVVSPWGIARQILAMRAQRTGVSAFPRTGTGRRVSAPAKTGPESPAGLFKPALSRTQSRYSPARRSPP